MHTSCHCLYIIECECVPKMGSIRLNKKEIDFVVPRNRSQKAAKRKIRIMMAFTRFVAFFFFRKKLVSLSRNTVQLWEFRSDNVHCHDLHVKHHATVQFDAKIFRKQKKANQKLCIFVKCPFSIGYSHRMWGFIFLLESAFELLQTIQNPFGIEWVAQKNETKAPNMSSTSQITCDRHILRCIQFDLNRKFGCFSAVCIWVSIWVFKRFAIPSFVCCWWCFILSMFSCYFFNHFRSIFLWLFHDEELTQKKNNSTILHIQILTHNDRWKHVRLE